MAIHENTPASQSAQAAEQSCLDLFNLGTGFEVTPDAFDAMQSFAKQERVPEDWYRQNYERREAWSREQRECGFIE